MRSLGIGRDHETYNFSSPKYFKTNSLLSKDLGFLLFPDEVSI